MRAGENEPRGAVEVVRELHHFSIGYDSHLESSTDFKAAMGRCEASQGGGRQPCGLSADVLRR